MQMNMKINKDKTKMLVVSRNSIRADVILDVDNPRIMMSLSI